MSDTTLNPVGANADSKKEVETAAQEAAGKSLTTNEYMSLNSEYCAGAHPPLPIVFNKGRGAMLWDLEGNSYIDFLSAFSVVNQGHCHPRIVGAMMEQCQQLALCTSTFQNEAYLQLCEKICKLLGYDMAASMNSGSEAVDLAIKIARKWAYNVKGVRPDEAKILTVTGNYHGKILGPLSGSSNFKIKSGFGPFIPNVGPDVAGFPVRFNNIEDIRKAVENCGNDLAAIVIECLQGFGGCIPAEPGYLQAIQDLCRANNVLFIADEIQTGFGRTGAMMAYQHDDVKPDMVVIGKALTGGMYPMSMVLGSRPVMTQVKPGEHSSTFAANPLASVCAIAAIDVVLSEGLPERAKLLGLKVEERLSAIKSPHTTIKVTGRGLLYAVHIDESHPSGRVTAARLSQLMRERGVATVSAENRVRVAPPLVIEEEELWRGLGILETALNDLADVE